jgi:hypothetical protein
MQEFQFDESCGLGQIAVSWAIMTVGAVEKALDLYFIVLCFTFVYLSFTVCIFMLATCPLAQHVNKQELTWIIIWDISR